LKAGAADSAVVPACCVVDCVRQTDGLVVAAFVRPRVGIAGQDGVAKLRGLDRSYGLPACLPTQDVVVGLGDRLDPALSCVSDVLGLCRVEDAERVRVASFRGVLRRELGGHLAAAQGVRNVADEAAGRPQVPRSRVGAGDEGHCPGGGAGVRDGPSRSRPPGRRRRGPVVPRQSTRPQRGPASARDGRRLRCLPRAAGRGPGRWRRLPHRRAGPPKRRPLPVRKRAPAPIRWCRRSRWPAPPVPPRPRHGRFPPAPPPARPFPLSPPRSWRPVRAPLHTAWAPPHRGSRGPAWPNRARRSRDTRSRPVSAGRVRGSEAPLRGGRPASRRTRLPAGRAGRRRRSPSCRRFPSHRRTTRSARMWTRPGRADGPGSATQGRSEPPRP